MSLHPHDADLAPDDRRQAVASILARGVLRWRGTATDSNGSDPDQSEESSPNPLEDCRGSCPHGGVVNARRTPCR